MWLLASVINLIKRCHHHYKDDTFQFSLLSTLINYKRHYFSHGYMDQLKNLFFISLILIISIHTDIRAIRQRYYLSHGDLIALFCKSLRYYLSNSDLIALFCKSLRYYLSNSDLIALFCKSLRYYLSNSDLIALFCKSVRYYLSQWWPNCIVL